MCGCRLRLRLRSTPQECPILRRQPVLQLKFRVWRPDSFCASEVRESGRESSNSDNSERLSLSLIMLVPTHAPEPASRRRPEPGIGTVGGRVYHPRARAPAETAYPKPWHHARADVCRPWRECVGFRPQPHRLRPCRKRPALRPVTPSQRLAFSLCTCRAPS